MDKKRIFIFVGTTAELIKLAPIIRELRKRRVKFTIVASGQNDIRFDEFTWLTGKIRVIQAVTPKSKKSSVVAFILWSLRTFFAVLIGMRAYFHKLNTTNSYFIVHGDTVSSLMGSLVAKLYGLTLVHVESGLRSFNFLEPFPEEICRYIISKIADIHFCPNYWTVNNLKNTKGIKVNTQHNTLIETFWSVMNETSRHPLVSKMRKKRYFVLVIHRQEHVFFGKNFTKHIIKFILTIAPKNLQCLFLIHDISTNLVQSLDYLVPKELVDNIVKVRRLAYKDFMHLLKGAQFMVTDGGSNQEEMYYMGKPCLLLRNSTERTEGLRKNVVLSRYNRSVIRNFFRQYADYKRNVVHIKKRPSKIIVDYLMNN